MVRIIGMSRTTRRGLLVNQLKSVRRGFLVGNSEPTAETIASILEGIPTIGKAREAMKWAGWLTSIAGNWIAVNNRVFARCTGESVDAEGHGEVRWVVYGIDDQPAVRIVVGQSFA